MLRTLLQLNAENTPRAPHSPGSSRNLTAISYCLRNPPIHDANSPFQCMCRETAAAVMDATPGQSPACRACGSTPSGRVWQAWSQPLRTDCAPVHPHPARAPPLHVWGSPHPRRHGPSAHLRQPPRHSHHFFPYKLRVHEPVLRQPLLRQHKRIDKTLSAYCITVTLDSYPTSIRKQKTCNEYFASLSSIRDENHSVSVGFNWGAGIGTISIYSYFWWPVVSISTNTLEHLCLVNTF